jgi:hypothetical protein
MLRETFDFKLITSTPHQQQEKEWLSWRPYLVMLKLKVFPVSIFQLLGKSNKK